MNVNARLVAAWCLLAVALVGWPVSMPTVAKNEPPFVLSLSWAAIAIEAINSIIASDVRKQQEDE